MFIGGKLNPKTSSLLCQHSVHPVMAGNARASHMMAMFVHYDEEELDKALHVEYLEKAAKGGYRPSRFYLARICGMNGDYRMAAAHAMCAACGGHDRSLELCQQLHSAYPEILTKDDCARALKSYESAHEERETIDRKLAKRILEQNPHLQHTLSV